MYVSESEVQRSKVTVDQAVNRLGIHAGHGRAIEETFDRFRIVKANQRRHRPVRRVRSDARQGSRRGLRGDRTSGHSKRYAGFLTKSQESVRGQRLLVLASETASLRDSADVERRLLRSVLFVLWRSI